MIRLALALCLLPGLAAAEQGDGQNRGRKRQPRREAPAEQPATPQMVMPDFRYTQTRGNKKVFSIFARRAETYPNKDVLLFDVEELLLYSEDGRVSKLTSEFGRWNGSAGDFEVWGNVEGIVETGEKQIGDTLRFETEKLVYKDEWKAVVTMKPVRLETTNAVTTGVGLNYNLVSQDLVITSSVETNLKLAASVAAGMKLGDASAGSRLVITAGQLLLQPAKKRAVYSTQPVLKMDENRLSGREMEFFLAEGEERLEVEGGVSGEFYAESEADGSLSARGGPPIKVLASRAVFHEPSKTATFLGEVNVERAGETLHCQKLMLMLNESGHDLESALAEDGVEVVRANGRAQGGQLLYRYSTGVGLLSREPRVILPEGDLTAELIHFRQDGSLLGERRVVLKVKAKQGAKPATGSSLDLQDGQPVEITSDRLTYAPEAGHAVFQDHVVVTRPGSKLDTAKLTLQTGAGGEFRSVLAEGGVRLVTEARLVSGDLLSYDPTTKQAYLQGQPARARTGEDLVEALRMTFNSESQEYSARDNVSIQLLGAKDLTAASQSEKQPLKATCGRAHFGSGSTRVELVDNVRLFKPDEGLTLQSSEVDLLLGETKQLKQMVARGAVEIHHQGAKAKGDEARYRADLRQLELLGHPAQVEKDGRQSFAERALYDLATREVTLHGQRDRVRLVLPAKASKP